MIDKLTKEFKIYIFVILSLATINFVLGYLTSFTGWDSSIVGCCFWLWLSMVISAKLKQCTDKVMGCYLYVCIFLLFFIVQNTFILNGVESKSFASSDALASNAIGHGFYRPAIESNIFPLWNPYIFGGMPSYASLQSAGPASTWFATKLNLGAAWELLQAQFPFRLGRDISDVGAIMLAIYFLKELKHGRRRKN